MESHKGIDMHLSKEQTIGGTFQLSAKGQHFKVHGITVYQDDKQQCAELIDNLADMLEDALIFANLAASDQILAAHGLERV